MLGWILIGTVCNSLGCYEVTAFDRERPFKTQAECEQVIPERMKNTAMFFGLRCQMECPPTDIPALSS